MMVHADGGLLNKGDGWQSFTAMQEKALADKQAKIELETTWHATVLVFGKAQTYKVRARNITEARAKAAAQVKVVVTSAAAEAI